MKDKTPFKYIIILLSFLTFFACESERGNTFNEVLAKTVKFFSPKGSEKGEETAEIFNIITSAEDKEENQKEIDNGSLDEKFYI